jgi:hexokinase
MAPEMVQNGVTVSITDKIRDYLRRHGFYYYRLYSQQISREFEKEYKKSLDPFNKRNLHVRKLWHQFDTLGKPRRIVSLDLGGTNLNLFDIRVQENNEYQIASSHSVNFYEDKVYTPEVLYHDLKHHLDLFLLDLSCFDSY